MVARAIMIRTRLHKLLLLIFIFMSISSARADGLLQLSLIVTGYPASSFPNAFTGIGEGGAFVYNFPATSHCVEARVLSEGTGSLYAGLYRGYLLGQMWSVAPDIKNQDLALQVRPHNRSIYWEVGMGYYSATHDIQFGTQTVSGGAAIASVGIEQPMLGVLGGLRFNIMNSIDSAVHFTSLEVNVGFPIKF
jgi:hypothetical protein